MHLKADTLASRLLVHTRMAHGAAERSPFVDGLVTGRLPLAAYAELTAQHWFIYETLELAAAAMADDPVARHFVFPELFRIPALEADLRYLYGARWQSRIAALPSTTTYCTRIRSAAFDQATGYVAHHCIRYLGDLSGGQWLGQEVVRRYGLRRGQGHRFFVFDGVDPPLFRSRYRDQLNAVPWNRSEQDSFLTEVSAAYQLNLGFLADLSQRWA